MSDSPRTDEILKECPSHLQEIALANLSMDLERELALSKALATVQYESIVKLETQVDKVKAEIEALTQDRDEAWQETVKAKQESEHIKNLLQHPNTVKINTIHRKIAKLSWDNYEQILGPHPIREKLHELQKQVLGLTLALDAVSKQLAETIDNKNELKCENGHQYNYDLFDKSKEYYCIHCGRRADNK
jgi:regulator of replication initiation timing